jgi:hypothetical protein
MSQIRLNRRFSERGRDNARIPAITERRNMTTPDSNPSRVLRMRPIAACLATLLGATLPAPAAASAPPVSAPHAVLVDNCNDSGAGSLRDAVTAAVSGDTIDMSQLTCSTISLTSGAIVFAQDDLTIRGPGRGVLTLDGSGNPGTGILFHLGTGTVGVHDLTIANGNKYRSDVDALGGCIYSAGSVSVFYSDVLNCSTRSAGVDAAFGGGIFTHGQTYLTHSRVNGNRTIADGGYSGGGGVFAEGGFISKYSTVADNTVITNVPPSFGGGVHARGGVFINASTFSGNEAPNMGGLALVDNGGANATIVQSTISGNRADYIAGLYSRVPLGMYNSTVAFNDATHTQSVGGDPIGAGMQISQLTYIHSSILSNNMVGTTFDDLGGSAGVILAGSNDIITGTTLSPPPDTIGFDPELGPLQDNGGWTRTHAPAAAGFAVDGGNNDSAYFYDQRGQGFARVAGAAADVGAFETNADIIFTNGFN